MTEIIPLVEALAKPTIRPRHWYEISEMCKTEIPFDQENFNLDQLLGAPLLNHREDIEDITESADKQYKLEKQLNNEIAAYWETCEFEIKNFKDIESPCILTGNILDIQEKFEEHSMLLNQMNAMRYVKPFKVTVQEKINLLAECQDTVEKWLKVQNLWTQMVAVFSSKSIAQELPQESKKFKKIDKQWLKIMDKANDTKNVITCCTNDILKQSLPSLQEDLEFCQKKLENFLESKRSLFPRFYFISNDDLLSILSMGSDPQAVQDDFEKLFDAIHKVTFDEMNKKHIKEILSVMKGATETIVLNDPVVCEGNIEDWLKRLEEQMQVSVKGVCAHGARDCFQMQLREFIFAYQSQIALLGIQIIWTERVEECLEKSQKEKPAELNKKGKDFEKMKNELIELCLTELNPLERCKIETLVTIHVHQVDVFREISEGCKANKIKDANDFDWAKNTRVKFTGDKNEVEISITDVTFQYSYEYLGAKERLCITQLTDRCYVTLAQALGMMYGGAPAGPAGTGKTETVKDLGRTLGIFVVVTNCSDEHKFRDMAKIFKGVCQSGLWGCFDEFNRISLPTLSVVAAQVLSITSAKKNKLKYFDFPGEDARQVKLILSCAYFITMNPGYAGRQELPENLKVLFRGVTMMQPDRRIIMMVKLSSVGYKDSENLSFKFDCLYKLCEEQLSAQRHYDFGLRNILSVLRTAGNSKRLEPEDNKEEEILSRTLRDMNLSKFVSQDIPLFLGLLRDIFPKNPSPKKKEYKDIETQVKRLMAEKNLIKVDEWFTKIVQLYETSLVRHGFMVVGSAGSGKTAIMNCLTEALTDNPKEPQPHKMTRMNPKSILGSEMYGIMNNISGEWIPGVFSEIWKKCNDKKNKNHSWIVCDGPVDAIWIENLNTVLDDNRILTLANAERIPMGDNTKMVFEVENLNNASPATVSRCGIIYVSATDLFWEPLIHTWVKDRQQEKV
jgi:dynein heavy chain